MKPSTMERLKKAINSYKGGDYYFLQEMKKEGIIYFDDNNIEEFINSLNDLYQTYSIENVQFFFNDAMRLDDWLLQRGEATTSTRDARQRSPLRDEFDHALRMLELLGLATVIKDGRKRLIQLINTGRKPKTTFDKFVLAINEKENLKKHRVEAQEQPPDIHGDIHLIAMTILEKLQPVLLNAIYTELMEHQK